MATKDELKNRTQIIRRRLKKLYPDAKCALDHKNAFELLEATILSAQCTDERVNQVTPKLFNTYPNPIDLAGANPEEVEEIIKPTGFFRNKTKSLIGMAQKVSSDFDGQIPKTMDELTTIPGVGRKTANVILSVAYDLPGLPVDTHVTRLSRRLGLTKQTDPVKIEYELNDLVPSKERGAFSLRLILHGRQICVARNPRCEQCVLSDVCPSSYVL